MVAFLQEQILINNIPTIPPALGAWQDMRFSVIMLEYFSETAYEANYKFIHGIP
jgi:hypothetical protein